MRLRFRPRHPVVNPVGLAEGVVPEGYHHPRHRHPYFPVSPDRLSTMCRRVLPDLTIKIVHRKQGIPTRPGKTGTHRPVFDEMKFVQMPPFGKVLERCLVLDLLVSIDDKRRQLRTVHVERQDVPEDGPARGDEGARLWTPDGVEDGTVLLLYVGHTSPSTKEGEREGVRHLRSTTDRYIEVVRDVLTPKIRFYAVESDIFLERKVDERGVEKIEIVSRESEGAVLDDRVGNPEGAGDLAVAGTGIESVVEVTKVDGKMGPVVDGEGLG